jgi:hypothetical protein
VTVALPPYNSNEVRPDGVNQNENNTVIAPADNTSKAPVLPPKPLTRKEKRREKPKNNP